MNLGGIIKRPIQNMLDLYYASKEVFGESSVRGKKTIYECINAGSGFCNTLQKSVAAPKIDRSTGTTIINEAIGDIVPAQRKGGIITFSYEVNAVDLSANKVANWFKKKLDTIKNWFLKDKKLDKIRTENEVAAWTVGNYLRGVYTSASGETFNEKSVSLEILDIEFPTLIKIAEEICREFRQESVLVKTYEDHRIFFVNPN